MLVPLRRRPDVTVLGAGALLVAIHFAFERGSAAQATVYQAAGLLAAGVIAVAICRRRPDRALHWWLLAATFVLWTIGDAIFSGYSLLQHRDPPFPSIADWIYLCGYSAMSVAMLLLIRARARLGVRDLLDTAIFGCGGGLLLWQLVIERSATQADGLLPRLVAVAYPTMDLLLLVALAQLLVTPGRRSVAFRLLVAGGGLLFGIDLLYGLGSMDGTYAAGSWIDGGWILNYACWAAAAAHPSMRELHRHVPAQGLRLSWWRVSMLAAATATAPVVMVVRGQKLSAEPLVLLGVALLMIAFVFVRMALLFRDHGRAVASLRDTTLRQAAEREAKQRFETAATTLECAVYERTGSVFAWTEGLTTVFGYPAVPETEACDWWLGRVHADDRDAAEAELQTGSGSARYRFLAADGDYRDVWDRWTSIPGSARVIGGMVDVTEQKALEAALGQAEKLQAVGTLAGGVAHDFNNLLMAIRGAAELASTRAAGDERILPLLREIETASDRAAGLTQQLLTFSRSGPTPGQVLDLNDSVSALVPMLERLLGGDVRVETDLAREPLSIRADAGQLDRVLINLAVNARDAMPDGGLLRLTTREVDVEPRAAAALSVDPGGYAVLGIADTGIGMTPETLAQAFEPFFTTKADGRGTGLGLATAYGIVTHGGGAIVAESDLGVGTRFTIYLPLSDEAATAAVPEPAAGATGSGTGTVLLVEDNPVVLSLLEEMLGSEGYTVVSAPDPATALRLVRAGQPIELVITDVSMPGMTGPALVEELRRDRPGLPVVFISGFANADVGSGQFLQKPFTLASLARAVRDALAA
jgi:signal transduction histidine kinase/CheY-like chemotaxis protein